MAGIVFLGVEDVSVIKISLFLLFVLHVIPNTKGEKLLSLNFRVSLPPSNKHDSKKPYSGFKRDF